MVVYSKPATNPLFVTDGVLGTSHVNMQFALHMINFWRYHIVYPEAQTLFIDPTKLELGDRPQGWKRPVFNKKAGIRPLSKRWKGSCGKREYNCWI